MTAAPFALPATKAQPSTAPTPPARYVRVPQRLIGAAAYHPLQIGVYSLVARLFLVARETVPLSAADITRYDPSLSRGAAQRALSGLVSGGWLIATERAGQKTSYVPAWGRVNGAPLPWRLGAQCLDRPRHVRAVCLDLRLLDLFLGKLAPHPKRATVITRYVTAPLLALADVGSYALLLAGLPGATARLIAWGLVRNEQPLALPEDQVILAQASQRTLFDHNDATLTARGLQKAGLVEARRSTDTAQPLFFVAPELIATLPAQAPASVIGQDRGAEARFGALQKRQTGAAQAGAGITWESMGATRSQTESPPTPQPGMAGGGKLSAEKIAAGGCGARQKKEAKGLEAVESAPPIPNTEAARALTAINVLPDQVIELADTPISVVDDAIRDGKARPYVRDLAGWVVTLIRARRDHGWTITPLTPSAESPEALRAAFARYAAEQEVQCQEDTDDCPAPLLPVPAPRDPSSARIQVWNDVVATLKLQLSRQEFNTWIRPTMLHSIERGTATIVAPNLRVKEAIEGRYRARLRDLLSMHVGEAVAVRVILDGAQDTRSAVSPVDTQIGAVTQVKDVLRAPERDPSNRPDWISAERWGALPAMLRAALIGSSVEDGQIRAVSPDMERLLQLRYAEAVAALLAG